MKVLIAVDGSEEALQAVDLARDLFGSRQDVTFVLVHVHQPRTPAYAYAGPAGSMDLFAYDPAQARELEAVAVLSGQRVLEDARQRLGVRGSRCELVEESGRPAERILAAANAHDVDLIVLGRRGLHGISRLFMGSVSSAVLERSHRPVLVRP